MVDATRTPELIDARTPMPAAALIIGGLLILTSALYPTVEDPAAYGSVLDVLADNAARTRLVLLAVPAGIWALTAGVAAIWNLAADQRTQLWLGLGLSGALVGAAAVTVQFALATAALANHVGGSFDGTVLWAGATYIRSFAMLILWAGLAAVGRGLLLGNMSARWLGLAPILLAVPMVLISTASIIAGPTISAALATGGLAGLTAIWSLLLGITLMRR